MTGYFKPLRRKIGVVTLGLACVLAAVWVVRGLSTTDQRFFASSHNTIEYVQSDFGGFCWMHLRANSISEKSLYSVCLLPRNAPSFPQLVDAKFENGQERLGFAFVNVRSKEATGFSMTIPYWSIVIPLTLLSTWLLLSRTRAPKLMPPVPENA